MIFLNVEFHASFFTLYSFTTLLFALRMSFKLMFPLQDTIANAWTQGTVECSVDLLESNHKSSFI